MFKIGDRVEIYSLNGSDPKKVGTGTVVRQHVKSNKIDVRIDAGITSSSHLAFCHRGYFRTPFSTLAIKRLKGV